MPAKNNAVAENPDPFTALRALDQLREAGLARTSLGLSPESLLLAWLDWAMHLAGAPGKRIELGLRLSQAAVALVDGAGAGDAAIPDAAGPGPGDPRFAGPAWQREPFRHWAQAFLLGEAWWSQATHQVPGTEPHHEDLVAFVGRQWLDMMAPSNWPWTNPEVIERTREQAGLNLILGGQNFLQDQWRRATAHPPQGSEAFVVGRNLACTPGKVVMRNELVELIQYSPTTATVHAEPILLVPAWIMKYYILDLSPHNSMVRWLVGQGHTVFCLSWRNVTEADRERSFDDYRRLGVMAALDAIGDIVPGAGVHAAGYCLGGTLLAIAAAAMAGLGDGRLASITLLAAQTDFSEPGELRLLIDPAQVHMLDSMMWQRGYLCGDQMSGAFQMLQANDLIWSRHVHDHLLGERSPISDLMAWNADSTRMPARMHSEYLHQLFLGNDLAAGRYQVDGHPIALQNIRLPIFAVGTERDQVAPWRSVYKVHYLTDTDLSFVLTSGGHNAGIVSEPGHPHRQFRLLTRTAAARCLSADEWQASAAVQQGSWWSAWRQWLVQHSSTGLVAPPGLGSQEHLPLADAPGEHVLQR